MFISVQYVYSQTVCTNAQYKRSGRKLFVVDYLFYFFSTRGKFFLSRFFFLRRCNSMTLCAEAPVRLAKHRQSVVCAVKGNVFFWRLKKNWYNVARKKSPRQNGAEKWVKRRGELVFFNDKKNIHVKMAVTRPITAFCVSCRRYKSKKNLVFPLRMWLR